MINKEFIENHTEKQFKEFDLISTQKLLAE
jgi:hypothetical protein